MMFSERRKEITHLQEEAQQIKKVQERGKMEEEEKTIMRKKIKRGRH